MKTYQATYIISSNATLQEADDVKKDVEVFVQSKGGVIIRSDKTNPQPLAWPINRQSSGYVASLEFEMAGNTIGALKEILQKNPHILRQMVLVKEPVKQAKERRTRRSASLTPQQKESRTTSQVFKTAEDKKHQTNLEDIDKKLDEILSE